MALSSTVTAETFAFCASPDTIYVPASFSEISAPSVPYSALQIASPYFALNKLRASLVMLIYAEPGLSLKCCLLGFVKPALNV